MLSAKRELPHWERVPLSKRGRAECFTSSTAWRSRFNFTPPRLAKLRQRQLRTKKKTRASQQQPQSSNDCGFQRSSPQTNPAVLSTAKPMACIASKDAKVSTVFAPPESAFTDASYLSPSSPVSSSPPKEPRKHLSSQPRPWLHKGKMPA